jgi:hypothetical protein
LTSIELGSEVLYRTKHSVYSITSHRFHAGFANSVGIFSSPHRKCAKVLIDDLQVDLIVVDGFDKGKLYARNREGGASTFYNKIRNGKYPRWLESVELPSELGSHYRVYRVNRPLI